MTLYVRLCYPVRVESVLKHVEADVVRESCVVPMVADTSAKKEVRLDRDRSCTRNTISTTKLTHQLNSHLILTLQVSFVSAQPSYEPRREKTAFLQMRKQRRRSASR